MKITLVITTLSHFPYPHPGEFLNVVQVWSKDKPQHDSMSLTSPVESQSQDGLVARNLHFK